MANEIENDPVYIVGWNAGLEWAAKWITGALQGYSPDVKQFATANAETIRAMRQAVPQQSFFDAVRNDPYMTPEIKAYWLAMENKAPPQTGA